MDYRPSLIERVWSWCWDKHPDTTAYVLAVLRNMAGIILPTLACAVLLQAAMLESALDYFVADLYDASFSFSTSSILLIELMRPPEGHPSEEREGGDAVSGLGDEAVEKPGFFGSRGFGVLLLGVLLLTSSGLAVNQVLASQYDFFVRAEFAPWINACFAFGVSCYIARVSVTSVEGRRRCDAMIEWAKRVRS